jgi:hypothetical protein
MEEKLFDLVGLGVPFVLAMATYRVFSWADSNASDKVTQDISSWLRGRSQNKPDLGNLIINAFDRIYTSPLLSFRAFRRSAAISSIIWILVFLFPWLVGLAKYWDILLGFPITIAQQVSFLLIVILSDYVSLLFVRRFLLLAQTYPMRASFLSSIIGLLVVTTSFFIFGFVAFMIACWLDPYFNYPPVSSIDDAGQLWWLSTFIARMRPAFIIHLWLPLFAISALAVRLVFWIFRAVEWAQRFLREGDAHPFKAIGIVATLIVFGSAMVAKEAWTIL